MNKNQTCPEKNLLKIDYGYPVNKNQACEKKLLKFNIGTTKLKVV